MPEEPPQGPKFSTKACTASLMPIVASAKNAPRSRRMPSPKNNARRLTRDAGRQKAGRKRPGVRVDQPDADVAAEPEEDDAAEIDVAGIAEHQIEIARERDIERREDQALAKLNIVAEHRQRSRISRSRP